jgi:exodeoxyribonuclease VII small subunit
MNEQSQEKISFEVALEKLQQTVKRLEGGELTLEQSLAGFEEGVRLVRTCQEQLATAEQKVEQLMQAGSKPELAPFTPGRD